MSESAKNYKKQIIMKNYWTDRDVADMVRKTQAFIWQQLKTTFDYLGIAGSASPPRMCIEIESVPPDWAGGNGNEYLYAEPSFKFKLMLNEHILDICIYYTGGENLHRAYTEERDGEIIYIKECLLHKPVPSYFVEFIEVFDKRIIGKTYPNFDEPDLEKGFYEK